MIDIYKTWIRDFGVDGFRIDTMKHVDDAFWQRFGPEVLRYARARGKREFFMFGEVFDTTKAFTSHFTTRDRMQAVLDFPFQAAAQGFAADSTPTDALRTFFEDDDWYTDADSNVYQLPTFLGNHDMGRIGHFVDAPTRGAPDAERLARDRLAHELMYLSRGNPVVYYGDEQGFAGDGGDQLARQDMFPSQVAEYNDDDLIGTDADARAVELRPAPPAVPLDRRLAALTRRHPALRDGAQQHRCRARRPGVYAFSRIDRARAARVRRRAQQRRDGADGGDPDLRRARSVHAALRRGRAALRSDGDRRLTVTVPPLSAVVYALDGRIPRSHRRRRSRSPRRRPPPRRADAWRCGPTSPATRSTRSRSSRGPARGWQPIGTDDNAPYRVFHDVAACARARRCTTRRSCSTTAGTRGRAAPRAATVPAPRSRSRRRPRGRQAARRVELRGCSPTPSARPTSSRSSAASPAGRGRAIGSDDSSPAYSCPTTLSGLGLATGHADPLPRDPRPSPTARA